MATQKYGQITFWGKNRKKGGKGGGRYFSPNGKSVHIFPLINLQFTKIQPPPPPICEIKTSVIAERGTLVALDYVIDNDTRFVIAE